MNRDAGGADEESVEGRPATAAAADPRAAEHGESDRLAGQVDAAVGAPEGRFPTEKPAARRERRAMSTSKGAFLVGAGILLSRIVGLVRQRVFAYFLGTSDAMDAFNAAFRIPNFLQNVFGEGALSASFIPVYAKLLAPLEGEDEAARVAREEEADRVAWAVFTILALVVSVLVLVGVLSAPFLIDAIAPGFEGEKRTLTLRLVQIFFPGAGLLVLSAWCLGVLNSHRRFFLSYTAPVIWNLTLIAALAWAGWPVRTVGLGDLGVWGGVAAYAAWGSVVGSALQFAIQLPTVLMLISRASLALRLANEHVRTVIRNFIPVFVSRGVVQISAYVDAWLASWLGTGAVAALGFAQSLYTLPVSLFGISVSAAELPEMSSEVGEQAEVSEKLRPRLDAALRRIALFIVPSAVGILALGDVMVGALYQSGKFGRAETVYVWAILAGAAVGLMPATLGRLYASTFYALHDTRTPLRFAALHVFLATALGYLFALPLPDALGIPRQWGAVGLTASAGLAGWIELVFLRRKLNRRIGPTGLPAAYSFKLWAVAILCAAVAWGLKLLLAGLHPIPLAALVLTPFGLLYFAATSLWGVEESRAVVGRFTRPVLRRLGR
ncbi:MAG TPA: murein biosynthesis integral membrane protein MurJ [Pyrinomonadaceae bacterium]|jgi:putative peptidoglycan lipid II flippase|nr:murein biosynthesis integral membrane protein MurJ [Pyrinomonadaceae bacterium]